MLAKRIIPCLDVTAGRVVKGINFVNLRGGITLGKFKDISKIRAAPRVDALRIVADDHHVFVPRRQQINQIALKFIRVLIFIDENKLKPPLILFAHFFVFLKQL